MKKLYRTKTFWGGLAAVVTGVGLIYTGQPSQGANAIVSGLLAIFLRDSLRKMSPDSVDGSVAKEEVR